ncbi:MAG TPA: septum site-determining protein MinC [Syntrophomonadaceae bacterium]|nr:septum site-determining protein MinC [Syntrophomonadaceae bacterium]
MAKVDIKGVNENLVFVFTQGSGDEYAAILKKKFETTPQIFNGSPVLFQGEGLKFLTQEEIAALQRLCLEYGMILHNVHTPTRRTRTVGEDVFVYRNLRSGQKLHSEGSMIIWGNVHESSEITAARDIIVLGRLEGIAHAGCYGDISRTIFALNLAPKQIRIGDKISIVPVNESKQPQPEVAYVEDNNICIRDYRPR